MHKDRERKLVHNFQLTKMNTKDRNDEKLKNYH